MANEFKIKKGLIVTGADGGTVVDIQGSQGQLFSVTDDLSGSIFAVSDISGVPILDVNSSGLSTFDGNVVIGSVDSVVTGLNIGEASPTIQLFDTTNDGKLLMYMQDSSAVVGTYSNHALKLFSDSTLALTLDTSQNAAFAGDVLINQITNLTSQPLQVNGFIDITAVAGTALRWYNGSTFKGGLGLDDWAHNGSAHDITMYIAGDNSYFVSTNNVKRLEINSSGATFETQAFATTATSSGDASSTLTTKGYVDGLITGATIYRGAWDPSGGGYGSPDLSGVTQTSGYYYICSAAGTAEPNGTGTEPDTWETGDWVIYNDVSGTGQWQKIDNSSVLSGVGTGQTVALWEGASSVTDSETLGNAPITVSGDNSTFAGDVTIGALTSGETAQLVVNQEGGVAPVAKFMSRTNKAIIQISDNDTTGYLSSENGLLSLGRASGVNAANININASNNVGIGTSSPASKLDVRGGMSQFSTTLTDNEDWENSPISINERGQVGSAQSADKYAPNLNFHWGGRASKSLWLGATGQLNFGEYSATGIPASDGRINAATFYGDHLGTINTATTGTTQTAGDDSTKIATTAYADAAAAAVPIGDYLPLAGGTMTGNVIFPGEEANSFKIAFTGASASSGLSTVDQSGAGLYIGANSRVNSSGNVVFHDTLLPSSGIYFDGWSGDDMEFYTGASGNPTKRLTISSGGTVDVSGLLYVNSVDQNNIGRYGNLRSEVGFTRSPITGNPNQWFKVVELGGSPKRIKFSIISTGDNTNSYDNFLISTSGYGMNTHIQKLPGGKYNTSKLLSVAAINPSNGGSVEIWIKLGPVSSGTGVTYVACTSDVLASATILASATTTAPTLTANDTQLDITTDNRNYATIQTSRGATFGAKVGIGTNAPAAMLTVAGGDATITGNVGIGTTSPDSKLEVAGGTTGILLSNLGDSSAYDAIRMTYNGYNSGTPEFIFQPKTAPGSGTVNSYFRFQTRPNGGAAGTGNVANVTVDGKIGIGTLTPGSKLSVDSVQQDALSINSSDGDGPYAVWKRQNGDLGFIGNANALSLSGNTNFGIRATNDLVFAAGGSTERMRINSAGNVGIGTANPLAKLDIQGTQGQLFSVTDDLSGDIFSVADISGVPIMNVNSDGTSYFDGNVGIGTDSPGAKLQVNGGIYATNYLSVSGVNTNFNLYNNGTTYLNGDTTVDSTFLVTNGNVGIGTTSPTDMLDVNGTSIFRRDLTIYHKGNNSAPSYELRFEGTNSSGVDKVHASLESSPYATDTNAGTLLFKTANASNQILDTRMVIDGVGNVGIGTTNPGAKLDVKDGSSAMRFQEYSNGASLFLDGADGDFIGGDYFNISAYGATDLAFGYGALTKMVMKSTGNVGIGTTSPSARIHADYSGLAGKFVSSQATGLEVQGGGNGQPIARFKDTSAAEKVTISSTGNVGIGNTSPANKLDVVGISRFTHSSSTSYRGAIETVVDNAYPTWDIGWLHARTGSSTYGNVARFNDQSGFQIGAITYNGSAGVSYATTSDYRLKENIKEISDSISRVKKLKPCRFNFTTEKSRVVDGFIAHEVQEVVPEAVHGEKDALQEDGSIDTQTLEVSRLIPVLTKALQEAIAKIEELELRIQTLENK